MTTTDAPNSKAWAQIAADQVAAYDGDQMAAANAVQTLAATNGVLWADEVRDIIGQLRSGTFAAR